jgi:hypothetical protein
MDQNPIVALDSEASKMNKKLLMKGELPPPHVISEYVMSSNGSSSS